MSDDGNIKLTDQFVKETNEAEGRISDGSSLDIAKDRFLARGRRLLYNFQRLVGTKGPNNPNGNEGKIAKVRHKLSNAAVSRLIDRVNDTKLSFYKWYQEYQIRGRPEPDPNTIQISVPAGSLSAKAGGNDTQTD